MDPYDVLIVGAGHAGAQAAISLRQGGFEGSLAIVADQDELPYERPPLSKDYLAGEKAFDRLLIRPESFWGEREVTMLLGSRVDAVDPVRRVVSIAGSDVAYRKLIWAAGGGPRRLTCRGADATNVYTVRRRADIDAITARLDATQHVTVVGGGYIGLEAASVLTKLGKKVLLLEALARVLARVAGEELSQFFEVEHRAHGVDLRTNSSVELIETSNGAATAVVMADGERVATDMVIVGVGIVAETQPLLEAGASGGDGVHVDEYCRTDVTDIYAVGDCAAHLNPFAGGARVRLESVQNATDQAKTAAAHIMGRDEPYCSVPWFWSNQYDLTLRTVGLSAGHDLTVVRGDPAGRSFSILYLKDGVLIALDSVNTPRDYMQARAHIVAKSRLDPAQLKDTSVALKQMSEHVTTR